MRKSCWWIIQVKEYLGVCSDPENTIFDSEGHLALSRWRVCKCNNSWKDRNVSSMCNTRMGLCKCFSLDEISVITGKGMAILDLDHFHIIMTASVIFHSALATFIVVFLAQRYLGYLSHTIMYVQYYPTGNSQVNNRKWYGQEFFHAMYKSITFLSARQVCMKI